MLVFAHDPNELRAGHVLHPETELKLAAMAKPVRVHTDLPAARLDNLLDDSETQAYALMVHLSAPMQFTEASEELWQVLR